MLPDLSHFHLLRPFWLLALLPLLAIVFILWRRQRQQRGWHDYIDPALAPWVLTPLIARQRQSAIWLTLLGGLLAIVALAGPAWERLPQPVWRSSAAVVVMLDLSQSMYATDLRPHRLERARLKLMDLLETRREGQSALIVFAATAYSVVPLTSDRETIRSQLTYLSPDLMPLQGSRADRAVVLALQLLQQARVAQGDLLLITDGVSREAPIRSAIQQVTRAGHRLSILGVGSGEGAPVALPQGGFLRDAAGELLLSRLDRAHLAELAQLGGGIYRDLVADDSDVNDLATLWQSALGRDHQTSPLQQFELWRDEGAWLLLPLILLALLAFRRGGVMVVLLLLFLPPAPATAAAWQDQLHATWQGLWQRRDQRAAERFAAGDSAAAAELFRDRQWQGAAHYRNGDYAATLEALSGIDTPLAAYNRGNAYAHHGDYQAAIDAWNEALRLDPGHEDARYNRDRLAEWLAQQPPATEGEGGEQERDRQGSQQQGDQTSEGSGGDAAGEQGDSGTQGSESDKGADGERDEVSQASAAETTEGDAAQPAASNSSPSTADSAQPPQALPNDLPSPQQLEAEQAVQQWLQRIPDDPSGLWRRKFLHQYRQDQQRYSNEAEPW
jgi:Ca-activated chloride channel homolog